jgi:GNAT superfamily N-acetyltransferase
VSVPKKYERRGIGRSIIEHAELFLLAVAAALTVSDEDEILELSSNELRTKLLEKNDVTVQIEMGVINKRTDLFPWYEKQGYRVESEMRPNDAELTRIILDHMADDVCCVKMMKTLL